jgi:hypothetical protein
MALKKTRAATGEKTGAAQSKTHTEDYAADRVAAQTYRLRLTARCLDLLPVFISDFPLCAELFDSRGRVVETWSWP